MHRFIHNPVVYQCEWLLPLVLPNRYRAWGLVIITLINAFGLILLEGFAKLLFLFEGHLPSPFFRPLMLIANQVQDSMDHQEDDHFHFVEAEPIRLALSRLNRNH